MVALSSHIILYEGSGKNVTGLGENLFILMKNFICDTGITHPHPDFHLHLHTYDYRQNKRYAVPRCRDKEVSLTSITAK